jgi:predicted P-loop ATPase
LTLTDISDKSGAEKLQGKWIVEIGELAGMRKADIEKVKAFLSTCDDQYRPSYGKTVESHPRQCIIIATVNGERGYLRDITGNRRFWIVKCHQTEQKKKFSFSAADRDQIWAEAMAIRKSGEKLYLEDLLLKEAESVQRAAMEEDDRQGMVEEYLETLLPEDWEKMELFDRRNYLRNAEKKNGTLRRETVSNIEIWAECFGNDPADMSGKDTLGITAIMVRIGGWSKSEKRIRTRLYGQQRVFVREV